MARNNYWVNQGQTYQEEKNGRYLWAPLLDKEGRPRFYWSNMKLLKKGDIVFNYLEKKVYGYCVVMRTAYDFDQPDELKGKRELWNDKGLETDVNYVLFFRAIVF